MLYQNLIKPILFLLDPESAHHFAASMLQLSRTIPFFSTALRVALEYRSDRLKQSIWGIEFRNPIGMAAGFDKTGELYPFLANMGFGFVEIGTITAKEQPGNEQPRLFRFPKKLALVNRMGFNNPGAIKAEKTLLNQRKITVRGINAGKSKVTPLEESAEDYNFTLKKLSPYADYAVINVSSPNTPGLRSLQSKESLVSLIDGIQKEFGPKFPIPLFLKFAPDLTDEDLLVNLQVCLDKKIDGVILTNTTLDKSSLEEDNIPEGGLSGDPLFEKSLHMVKIAYRFLKGRIPIIGVGGIHNGERALQMILSGANLIQVYTGYIYEGPMLPSQICSEIDHYLIKHGHSHISEIIGKQEK
ncbi:dihydroorotate dehydrogenase 2 [Leptospira ryugenii]|uniref:Dihydroorotate dehydrogenase (quinone) n=1 Tax=Leptospira ryugenii TaxID=1917863 RepID=A0A2P2E306_9LEPT|nr:quinone-dependent dihydroorotate dehydrogenase [Leptospira ryugenii]GBF51257.1 dihydroorotate dehydrogenase 2 [Leptospira ryugenii]